MCIYGSEYRSLSWENESGSVEDAEGTMRGGANNCKASRETPGKVHSIEVHSIV